MIIGSKGFLAAIIGSLFLQAVLASEMNAPVPDDGLWQLMQKMGQVKTAKGSFVERKYLQMLDRPLEFSGTLLYSAPDHLEKHTLYPKREDLFLEQNNLTIEKEHGAQRQSLALEDYPVIWALVESIRSTLAGDLSTLKRFYNVNFEGDEEAWHLRLMPRDPKMQQVISEIRINGRKNWIDSIDTLEPNGDHSSMTVTKDAP